LLKDKKIIPLLEMITAYEVAFHISGYSPEIAVVALEKIGVKNERELKERIKKSIEDMLRDSPRLAARESEYQPRISELKYRELEELSPQKEGVLVSMHLRESVAFKR
jgi:hypothetical protein